MTDGLILQIVVPLMSAPLCVLLRNGVAAAAVSLLVAVYAFANGIVLLQTVQEHGTISYLVGGVAIPYGIEYRLDALNAFVLVVVAGVNLAATVYAAVVARHELVTARRDLFFACWQLCVTGIMGIAVTGDVFNVFVFLEIASLSGYVLVAHGGERRCLMASFRYLLMGTLGATFLVIGIGLLYLATGTLNMGDLAQRLPPVADTRGVRAAFAFVAVGLCLKAAVFPLHLWLPGAYATAPAAVSALLAGTATKVALYLWVRFFFTIFAPSASFSSLHFDQLLLGLGLVGALAGSLAAVFQDEPKRVLAWSSIGQVGYMVAGLSLASTTGLTAMVSHLANHAVVKAGLFLALGAVVLQLGATRRTLRLADLRGLGKAMPWTAAAITIGGFGLIGMPLTCGFVGKWLLVEAMLERGMGWAIAVVLLSSLLAVVYVWRLVEAMYFQAPADDAPAATGAVPKLAFAPLWALVLLGLVFGVWTDFNVGFAGDAVRSLLSTVGGPR
jgi:multicomponent Na+:H+ antiporter subunit D